MRIRTVEEEKKEKWKKKKKKKDRQLIKDISFSI